MQINMKYANIYKFDISNGPGIRVSLFVQGCPFHCKGCFNPETWDFNGGKEFTYDTGEELLNLADHKWITGLSILGGEPLSPENIKWVAGICYAFKKWYPDKNIWIWTGYTMDELEDRLKNPINHEDQMNLGNLLCGNENFKHISLVDVIIDGRFEENKKDLSLKWRGSSNQHIWRRDKKMDENPGTWHCIE